MATNGALNDMEQWRSVVEYQQRTSNPAYDWQTNRDVPYYLDEYDDEIQTAVRGPYQSAGNARRQATREAAELLRMGYRRPPPPEKVGVRIVRTCIERASLAWEPFDERNTETGKWGG
ncbi:hypothetical protein OG912_32355 [Streptomyces sp. NBC_00464]|uniref:hypothetical protein n=1 Tax=Streptomyces sp. NBC_00464 TaxID=2975751 RepID=UPI002E17335C